jgi:hypothetical protein
VSEGNVRIDISKLMQAAKEAEAKLNRLLAKRVTVCKRPIDPAPPGQFGRQYKQRCEAFTCDPTTSARRCQFYARSEVDGWHVCNVHARLIDERGLHATEQEP